MLSSSHVAQFHNEGFLVLHQQATPSQCDDMRRVAHAHLLQAVPPLEYETEVGYAGAPASIDAVGGRTVRRLRNAWQRAPCFADWAGDATLLGVLRQLLAPPLQLNLAHHNCVMTKHPAWGTATGWHRDMRYWRFSNPNLITVWLALGDEHPGNGGLKLLPGSHRWSLTPEQLDERDFLRDDLPANQMLITQAISPTLSSGDVLLFHSNLLHAAGRNDSAECKFSVAFAYHGSDTVALPGTRSENAGEIYFA